MSHQGIDNFFDDHHGEIEQLASQFNGHVPNIDVHKIRQWIRQFNENDFNVALKLLRNVSYYSPSRVAIELKGAFEQFKAVKSNPFQNTYFAPFSVTGGGSDILTHTFRLVTKSKPHEYDSRFINISQVGLLAKKKKVSLVLLEDFVGTGNTTVENWENIAALVPREIDVYLLLITGFGTGIARIENETRLQVIANVRLDDSARAFHQSNSNFTLDEKNRLRDYCYRCTPPKFAEGYKSTQSLVVFHHRTPNNVIAILWYNSTAWHGLFTRYL